MYGHTIARRARAFLFLMSEYITVLIKQGQHTGTVLDALLRGGFELVERGYTHAGRELILKPPPEHLKDAS
jgi:hypothetical protein